jgi:hypothetical protein
MAKGQRRQAQRAGIGEQEALPFEADEERDTSTGSNEYRFHAPHEKTIDCHPFVLPAPITQAKKEGLATRTSHLAPDPTHMANEVLDKALAASCQTSPSS